MDLLTPEEDIVARLKDQLGTTAYVEAFPNAPESFDYTQPTGVALVRYNASTYSAPKVNRKGGFSQDRTGQWHVAILNRNLRTHTGIYPLLEAIRAALTGYTPAGIPDASILYPIRDGFVTREPSKWIYEIVFALIAPEVAA